MTDEAVIEELQVLAFMTTKDNVGDIFAQALEIYNKINSAVSKQVGEYYIAQIRSVARDAEVGWKLFSVPPALPGTLSDEDSIRLITIIATLHSYCYGSERLDEASFFTGPNSTPVRFYINSIYHYIAALYLLDKKADPMGGMVYKTLASIGLESLLDPIQDVLSKPMEEGITFGETIQKIRNKFLVHGSFSPNDISSVVKKSKLRDFDQIIRLADRIWELFNQSFMLKLKLIAVLTASNIDMEALLERYKFE